MRFESIITKLRKVPILGFFLERSFFHYAWVGGIYSIANIVLLWLLIDIVGIPTIVSSTVVIGGTFILRYIVFRVLKVM